MKKIIGLVIIMLLTTCLVACGKEKADYKLVISSTFWSYGTNDSSSRHPTEEFDVETGKEYSYGTIKLNFEIIKINDDSIVIKTKDSYSSLDNSKSYANEFTVTFEDETVLKSLTDDAGETYYLILKKGE